MHFKRFLASEKAKNESWKLEKKLQSLNALINPCLSSKYDENKVHQIRYGTSELIFH